MSIKDKKRIPKIALIENGKEIQEIELKDYEKNPFKDSILDDNGVEERLIDSERFFDEISSLEQESANLGDLITKIAKQENLSLEVLEYINSVMLRNDKNK